MKPTILICMAAALAIAIMIFTGISCKKEQQKEVYAGRYDENFHHHQYNPPLQIDFQWDDQNLYGQGSMALDLDLDGVNDLVIDQHILNRDSLHLLPGMPNPFPNARITLFNGFEAAFYSEIYPIGLGQTNTAYFADTLQFQERIDPIIKWFPQSSDAIALWQENPGNLAPSFGGWYYARKVMYIGLRRGSDRYGWIEMDATDPYDPKISRWAFQD